MVKVASKWVETNKGKIWVRKYSYGWAVFHGPYQGSGSYNKLVDLVAAINAAA